MNVQPVRNNSVPSETVTIGGNCASSSMHACWWANLVPEVWSSSRTSPALWTPDSCWFSKSAEHSTMSSHVSQSCMIWRYHGVWGVTWRLSTGFTSDREETWWTPTPAHHVKGMEAIRTSLSPDWTPVQPTGSFQNRGFAAIKGLERSTDL